MLSIVKSDCSEKTDDLGVPEEFRKRYPCIEPKRLKELYDFNLTPLGDIAGYRDRKKKELKVIAHQELMAINYQLDRDLPNGRRRLYSQAAMGFQTFIDSEDVEFDVSKEMIDLSYFVLLYYIDKLYPGVDVELDLDNKVILLNRDQDQSDESPRLLEYLLKSWINLSNLEATTIYGMMLAITSEL